MIVARFKCEMISLMAMGNATTNGYELRSSPITSAMRFWWRAIMSIKYGSNLKGLQKEEFGLFGGAAGSGKRSSFDMFIENKSIQTTTAQDHFRSNQKQDGYKYLFYILVNQQNSRRVAKEGSTFDLVLVTDDSTKLTSVVCSLWLLVHLGGVGSRSRRGGGSFMVNSIEVNGADETLMKSWPSFSLQGENNAAIIYESEITRICKLLGAEPSLTQEQNQELYYSNLINQNIYVSKKGFVNSISALNDIGNLLRWSRGHAGKPDQSGYKVNRELHREFGESLFNSQSKSFTSSGIIYKSAFGLPISLRNNDGIINLDIKSKSDDEIDRRSSPIIVSVTKIANNIHWVVTFLDGRFMPKRPVKIEYKDVKSNIKKRLDDSGFPLNGPDFKLYNFFQKLVRENSNYAE